MNRVAIVVVAALAASGIAAHAGVYVESFDDLTIKTTPWLFGGINEIPDTGGNPGAWLHASGIDSVAPWVGGFPKTSPAEWVFTGNYREKGVTAMGVDAITIAVDFPNLGNRPLTLMLFNDNGTPDDPSDDYAAINRGANIPYMDQGWLTYDYNVPADSTVLPANWSMWRYGYAAPENPDWTDVITNVSYVGFMYGDPELFYIFQMWSIGIDNPRITWVPEPSALGLLALGGLTWLRRR